LLQDRLLLMRCLVAALVLVPPGLLYLCRCV
jgi:hypothetical protein